jgi:pentatricopeptide repeat protein
MFQKQGYFGLARSLRYNSQLERTMSEMLGNQYFLSRNFDKATHHLKEALITDPDNEKVQKKLVICYCETGHVQSALDLFDRITSENIELIAETDLVAEDCPCPEIVERMRWYEQVAANSFDFHCILGMLNLYCDINDSLKSFSQALKIKPENKLVQDIYETISNYETANTERHH